MNPFSNLFIELMCIQAKLWDRWGMIAFVIMMLNIHLSSCNNVSCTFETMTSVRVSNELGAGHPKAAQFSVVVVNVVCFIISVVAAIIVLALRHVISYAFTGGEVVAHAVSDLTPLLSLTLVLNGIQPVLSGIKFIYDVNFWANI